MNGLAMARYGPRLSQDGATGHRNLLEAYLTIINIFRTKKRQQKKTLKQETTRPISKGIQFSNKLNIMRNTLKQTNRNKPFTKN